VSDSLGIQLLFDVTNSQTVAVEIGSLGAPLEFNNVRIRAAANSSENWFDKFNPDLHWTHFDSDQYDLQLV
jgi:hypothetical protein